MTNNPFRRLRALKSTLNNRKLTALLLAANVFFLTLWVGGWTSSSFPKFWSQETKRKVEKRHGALTEPIEIIEPSVKGVAITLGKEFDGQSDWIKNLRFKIRNKYTKAITFLGLDLDFPETIATGPIMMHQLFIGQRVDLKFTQNHAPLSLQPNGEVEIRLEPEFQSIKLSIESRQGPVQNINNVVIRVREVMFEDGTLYTPGGNFWRPNPDPNSPHKWILITDEPKKP